MGTSCSSRTAFRVISHGRTPGSPEWCGFISRKRILRSNYSAPSKALSGRERGSFAEIPPDRPIPMDKEDYFWALAHSVPGDGALLLRPGNLSYLLNLIGTNTKAKESNLNKQCKYLFRCFRDTLPVIAISVEPFSSRWKRMLHC